MALSRIVAIGNGVTKQFAIPFALGYISELDIACRVGDEQDGAGDPIYRTLTFLSPELVEVSGTAPDNGVRVVFTRTVNRQDLIIDYEDGDIINEDNMNTAQKQAIMLVHEVLDGRFEQFQSDVDMGGFKITGLAPATVGDGAVTLDQALLIATGGPVDITPGDGSVATDTLVDKAVTRSKLSDDLRRTTLAKFNTAADLYADTTLGYADTNDIMLRPGDIFEAGGARYETLDNSSTEYSLIQTAGGVKSRVREFSVKPEMWGAVSGIVSSGQRSINTAAFRAWLRYVAETGLTGYIPYPRYEIDGAVLPSATINTDIHLKIIAPNGCLLDYLGAGNINHVFDLRYANIRYGHVEGVSVNGNNKAHCGIVLTSSGVVAEALIARHCSAENLRVLDDATITAAAAGIRVATVNANKGVYGELLSCTVRNMTKAVRSGGTLPCQAMVATNFDNLRFDGNTAENVQHDGVTKEDADGFVIFSGIDSGASRRTSGSIDNNIAKDCDGRGFKLQTNGPIGADGNAVSHFAARELIPSWCAFESQTGDCHFTNSQLDMGDLWTGGAQARALYMQIPLTPKDRTIVLESHGLHINVAKELSRLWEVLVRPSVSEVLFDVSRIFARGKGAITSVAAGDCAADIFCVLTGQTGLASSAKITIRTRDTDVHCRNHNTLAIGTSGLASWTDIVHFDSDGDTDHPTNASKPFWSSSSSSQTSSVTLRNSKIGSLSRIDGDLDWAKFGSGFDAYVGSGTMANAASQTFRRVSKQGQNLMTMTSTAIRVSADNGATWSANIT